MRLIRSAIFLLKMQWAKLFGKLHDRASSIGDSNPDILLMQCPPWDTVMPALGIAYLSAYLRQHGYKTAILDLNISLYHLVAEDLKYLWDQKSYNYWVVDDLYKNTSSGLRDITNGFISQELNKFDVEFIGLSVNFSGIKFACEILKKIRETKPQAKIILGGWGCVNEHMRGLFPRGLVDVFVVGEGEEALKEVIEALRGKRNPKEVAGAVFAGQNDLQCRLREPIKDLDSLPRLTFEEFNLKKYTAPVIPLFTSRGCISSCNFCNDWRISKPFRYRSAKNVFDEIKYHTEFNRIKCFSFKDLLCNGNIARINLLSELIIDFGIQIHWDSQAIPLGEMTYELLCKLKKSGCVTLIYGVESFSDNVLKRMKKLFTRETAERVIRDTRRAGINTIINIIVGFPGETQECFLETYNAIERNRENITQIGALSTCLVNNDTDLEINAGNYGLILPSDANVRAKEWFTQDRENTYEIRRARAEKILGLLKELGLSYVTTTM